MAKGKTVKVCSVCGLRVEDCVQHRNLRVDCRFLLDVELKDAPARIRAK